MTEGKEISFQIESKERDTTMKNSETFRKMITVAAAVAAAF